MARRETHGPVRVLSALRPDLGRRSLSSVANALGDGAEPRFVAGKKKGRDGLLHIPQRSAGVRTGASHSGRVVSSAALTVIEQPAISSEVTYEPVR